MNTCDVVIVGGGAAGLSAALVLSRANRQVVVVDAGSPRNAPAAHMHGYLSRDGMPPAELLAIGRREVEHYGGAIVSGTATSIVGSTHEGFRVGLADGHVLTARRILITTGLADELPDIAGLAGRWGRDLLHCPYCHGHEVRNKRVAILGGTPDAVQHALLIRQWADDVVYFPHTDDVSAEDLEQLTARAIGVVRGNVAGLVVEDDRVVAVALSNGAAIERDVAFVRPRLRPNTALLVELGAAVDDRGRAAVDATGATSVPGVWAAGNAANPRAQVITAAGEGSAAAIAINQDLTTEDVANDVQRFRATSPTTVHTEGDLR